MGPEKNRTPSYRLEPAVSGGLSFIVIYEVVGCYTLCPTHPRGSQSHRVTTILSSMYLNPLCLYHNLAYGTHGQYEGGECYHEK